MSTACCNRPAAWRSLSRYDGTCRFSTWLFSILLHRHQKALIHHRWNEAQLLALQQWLADKDLLAESHVALREETFITMNMADQLDAWLEGRHSPWVNTRTLWTRWSPTRLKQVPADLLDPAGVKLRYCREADGGFLLYSIGLNRLDDHGKPGPPDTEFGESQAGFPHLDEGDWAWSQPGR